MEKIGFLELVKQFEAQLKDIKFELQETNYTPYAFGSGMVRYRINGRYVKIFFDGRDRLVEVMVFPKHNKYTNADEKIVFNGTPADFIKNAIAILKD